MKKQEGSITTFCGRWYLRYYETVNAGGELVRRRLSTCLGPVTTRGKTPPASILEAAAEHMMKVNHSKIRPDQNMHFADFVETRYLPWVQQHLRPSAYRNAENIWRIHAKPQVTTAEYEYLTLKNVRTCNVQQWLDSINDAGWQKRPRKRKNAPGVSRRELVRSVQHNLSRNSLKRIKAFFSGVFKEAKRLGFYDGPNPTTDVSVDPHAPEPQDTYAYSLEEINQLLSVFPEPAATAFAVAAFTGLRRGEIEGLSWEDFHDGCLWVSRSIWNGRELPPKTPNSKKPVPVMRQLAQRLEMHRLRCGDPKIGPMFATSLGTRLSINNVLNRQMRPAMDRCKHCGLSKGKPHVKADHKFERDPRLPEWHGWHAARRGLSTNLFRLGVPDKTIQSILRHSNVQVTQAHYIKPADADAVAAMGRFEAEIAAHEMLDSDRTVNRTVGAQAKAVN